MSGEIRIKPEEMRRKAVLYEREALTVNGVIKKMDTLLLQLQSEWEGESSKAFVERYQELKPAFQKAEILISEIAKALKDTAKIQEETDQNLARQYKR